MGYNRKQNNIIKKRRDFFSKAGEKPLRLFEKKYNLVGKSGHRYDPSHEHHKLEFTVVGRLLEVTIVSFMIVYDNK